MPARPRSPRFRQSRPDRKIGNAVPRETPVSDAANLLPWSWQHEGKQASTCPERSAPATGSRTAKRESKQASGDSRPTRCEPRRLRCVFVGPEKATAAHAGPVSSSASITVKSSQWSHSPGEVDFRDRRNPDASFPKRLSYPSYLVDPASSHMLVSKIKPCMCEYRLYNGETANGSLDQLWFLRSYNPTWITVAILELIHADNVRPRGRTAFIRSKPIGCSRSRRPVVLVTLDNFVPIARPSSRRRVFQMSDLSNVDGK